MSQRKAGVILTYISETVLMLTGLIYTPVMLRLLGRGEYGLYQLVYSVVSYLGLLSLGFSSSYMRFYSRYRVRDDEDGIRRLNGMFLTIFLVISVICILCGGVMITNVSGIFGSGLRSGELSKAKILMVFMVFDLALTFPDSVFNCFLTAHERFVFQKGLGLAKNILNPFLTLPLLIAGYGSVGMVFVTTCLTVASFLCNIFYCIKVCHMRFGFSGFQLSLFGEMFRFTFFIFLNQIIDQINWSVDKFLLGRMAGTAAVAVYGVGGQLNAMVVSLSTAVSNVFVPEVNRIVADSDNPEKLSDLFVKVGRVQYMIMALVISGFVFFGRSFIRFWAGSGYEEAYPVTVLLIVSVIVPLIQNIGIEIQRAKNMHQARSIVYFVISIGNVLVSIPLIYLWGPTGAAVGTALALIIGNTCFMNWYYAARIGIDIRRFWKNIARISVSLIVPFAVGCVTVQLFNMDNVQKLILGIGIYTLCYMLSVYLCGMDVEEKLLVTDLMKRLTGRGGKG